MTINQFKEDKSNGVISLGRGGGFSLLEYVDFRGQTTLKFSFLSLLNRGQLLKIIIFSSTCRPSFGRASFSREANG